MLRLSADGDIDGELALVISDSEVRVFVFRGAITPEGFKPDLSDLTGSGKSRITCQLGWCHLPLLTHPSPLLFHCEAADEAEMNK